ncbi:transmembrane protein 176B-like isoform X1 [Ambystoma mexicanum]|uniref:transmembrane protein 176B-like isoform X1 n=1 Tax=Ambystoma mexicanum TaxID=8296 RepID=UPI0037E946F9
MQPDVMSSNVVKVNGVEDAINASKPTVINININHQSNLSTLLVAAKSAFSRPSPASSEEGVKNVTPPQRGEQKVIGAVQIMIGLLCIAVAVIFCFVRNSLIFDLGSGFWTGIPFIVVGAVCIIGEKRATTCWRVSAWLLNWVSLAVAIAGIVIIVQDLIWRPWYLWSPDYLCNPRIDSRNWGQGDCKYEFYKLMNVFNGMRIMLLVATCLAMCAALYALGYGCKTLCCDIASEQEDEELPVATDQEPLLTSQPFPEKKPLNVETV